MGTKSPFPSGFMSVEMSVDNTWTVVNTDFDQSGVQVHHGASSEGGAADVTSLAFALRNGEGKYNPRNPSSPWYGKIGRNTPARAVCRLGAPWLSFPANLSGVVSLPDTPAISITGDLDVRWWGEGPLAQGSTNLVSKWGTSGQFSWAMTSSSNGFLNLFYSPNGTTSNLAMSTVPIPAWAGKIALRATIDVNDGAGGRTIRFYYAKDLDSTWYSLGDPIRVIGTTSLFDNTAALTMWGSIPDIRVYGYEVRSGINGAIVSSFRFDRAVVGWDKSSTLLRTNMWYEPTPGGALGTRGLITASQLSIIDDTTYGRAFEVKKVTTSAVAQGFTGFFLPPSPSTTYKIAFDAYFEGSGSTGDVQFYYRPSGASSTTGQVSIFPNLQDNTSGWKRMEATFTTTATATGGSATFTVVMPSGYATGSRLLMRNITFVANTVTDLSPLAGDTRNTSSRFYYWSGTPFSSTSLEYGATATVSRFTDDQRQAWLFNGTNYIQERHILAVGEIAEFPVSWGRTGKPSVFTNITANGVSRRLGQGEEPVQSPIYRAITGAENPALVAYWPMEDGAGSSRFGSAVGGLDAWWAGTPSLATYTGLGGSKPLPTLGTTRIRGRVARTSVNATGLQVRWVMNVPSGGPTWDPIEIYLTGGNLNMVRLRYDQPGGGMTLRGYSEMTDTGRIEVPGGGGFTFDANDKDVRVGVELAQSGSNVTWRILMNEENKSAVVGSGTFTGVTLFSITDVLVNSAQVDTQGVAFGHLTIEKGLSSIYDVPGNVLGGYQGETGEARLRRLVAERGIPIVMTGSSAYTSPMGPQGVTTWLDAARAVEAADGGILYDNPTRGEGVGFQYRTLQSMMDQPATIIDYEDNLIIPFEPVDDDAMTRNRITRSKVGGSPYTAVQTTGPLSTLPAPVGAGIYEDAQEFNWATDDQAVRAAQWGLHIGTWDDTRYPTIGVDLAHPRFLNDPVLTRDLLVLTIGDRLVIKNPPSWLPPFDVDVIVTGVNYNVTPHHLFITWTCIPARPYRVAYFNKDHRYSGEGTTLTSSVTTTGTALALTLPTGVTWTSADGSYDIVVGGEVMTVTSVTGGNAMTVVRSVNGVVKSHAAGEAVSLASPSFYAR